MAKPPKLRDTWAAPPIDNKDGSWTFHGRIMRVVDGDTVWVRILVDQGFGILGEFPYCVRLARIDAPEMNRPESAKAGSEATAWAIMTFPVDLPVIIHTHYVATLSRLVAEVERQDGLNWSNAIVAAGHAVFRAY